MRFVVWPRYSYGPEKVIASYSSSGSISASPAVFTPESADSTAKTW